MIRLAADDLNSAGGVLSTFTHSGVTADWGEKLTPDYLICCASLRKVISLLRLNCQQHQRGCAGFSFKLENILIWFDEVKLKLWQISSLCCLEKKIIFRFLTYQLFPSSRLCSLSVRQTVIMCTWLIFIPSPEWCSPRLFLFQCTSPRRSEKVGISCIIVGFQKRSGEALCFPSQPVGFHGFWLTVKTRQQHDVGSFYLPLNHFLKLLLLSAGGVR